MNTSTEQFKGHTPGEWRVTESGGIAGSGEVIVLNDPSKCLECECLPINNGHGRAEANKRLMAAAPTLLEQRDKLASALEQIANRISGQSSPLMDSHAVRMDTLECLKIARAILAEVRGGQ